MEGCYWQDICHEGVHSKLLSVTADQLSGYRVYMIKIHLLGLFIGLWNVTIAAESKVLYVCCKGNAVDDLSPSSYMVD